MKNRIEDLRSKQRRTDPPLGGELGEANLLAGIQNIIAVLAENEEKKLPHMRQPL